MLIFCMLIHHGVRKAKSYFGYMHMVRYHMVQLSQFFWESLDFLIYPPSSPNWTKISRLCQKTKNKKIALQENISYYEILFYFMFLSLTFQFSQNNKHKITKETCNSFRCLPLKYFSLFIYNNCITLHLT